eukprot:7377593-Alexandrium_andersonii.AAC.1
MRGARTSGGPLGGDTMPCAPGAGHAATSPPFHLAAPGATTVASAEVARDVAGCQHARCRVEGTPCCGGAG